MDAIRQFLSTLLPLILGVVAIIYWRRHNQSALKGFGFTFNRFLLRDFVVGLIITFLGMLGIFVVELLINAIEVAGTNFDIGVLGATFAQFTLYALIEEVLYRSLLLSGLVVVLRGNKWVAILISAAMFGIIHLANPNASVVAAFGNALGGIIYGIAFLGAKNVWLPLGLHISWNFSQALLGFPVSRRNIWDT